MSRNFTEEYIEKHNENTVNRTEKIEIDYSVWKSNNRHEEFDLFGSFKTQTDSNIAGNVFNIFEKTKVYNFIINK